MCQPTTWLLGGLFGLMWVIPVLMTPTTLAQCKSLKTLETKLTDRRRNFKHNFPINYTIRVHYEEIFKLCNISRLRVRVVDLEEGDLQGVWLLVNQEVLKRILRVLPERHPSYKYTSDLEDLFRKIQQVFPPQSDEREPPERIEEIYNRVKEPNSKGWRFVTPKSLLDNCYRTMHCLFKNCFPSEDGEQDYCSTLHWRKGRKRQLQETRGGR
ncbi:interleukin-34-like isoform X2 [Oncorhynchus masou masou]|uniref:interleukin-34-like isoform X2 n=1 Tax=Oncorhynchus masou masou TaxID=90313 RepID=UPI003183435D